MPAAKWMLIGLTLAGASLSGCASSRLGDNDRVVQRQSELRSELAAPTAGPSPQWAEEWAGTYEFHDWWSIVVDLTPSGVTYVHSGCGGINYASFGRIQGETPGGLAITPVIGDDYLDRLLLVRWKGDHYVVPERAASLIIERIDNQDVNPMWGFPKLTGSRVSSR